MSRRHWAWRGGILGDQHALSSPAMVATVGSGVVVVVLAAVMIVAITVAAVAAPGDAPLGLTLGDVTTRMARVSDRCDYDVLFVARCAVI